MAPVEIQPSKIGRKGERKKSDEEGEGNEKAKDGREERRKGKMTRPFFAIYLLSKREDTRLTLKEDNSRGEKESKTVRTYSKLTNYFDLLVSST